MIFIVEIVVFLNRKDKQKLSDAATFSEIYHVRRVTARFKDIFAGYFNRIYFNLYCFSAADSLLLPKFFVMML